MFGNVKGQEIVVDFDIDRVYDEMLKCIPTIKGFKVKSESKMAHSISVSFGASLFSWGELLSITMQRLGDQQTKICFAAQSKMGTEIVSNSKNQKNIDNIIAALENRLS